MDLGAANRKGFARVGVDGVGTVIRAQGIVSKTLKPYLNEMIASNNGNQLGWYREAKPFAPRARGFLFREYPEDTCIILRWKKLKSVRAKAR